MIELARRIAIAYHSGVTNHKTGEPYARHPERVAAYTRLTAAWCSLELGEVNQAVAVAWLHDVIEDTEVTVKDLRDWGVSPEVEDAVVAITKVDGQPLDDYYTQVNSNKIARVVKWADMIDNSDPSRLVVVMKRTSIDTVDRLIAKYDKGAACLNLSPTPKDWWQMQHSQYQLSRNW